MDQHRFGTKKQNFKVLLTVTVLLFCFLGTRYRRRGVDDNGDVANYVETEQV